MSLDKCLQEIKVEGAALSNSLLYDLCDLAPAEVATFTSVWSSVAIPRKLKVLEDLTELTQDSAELDFTAVFRQCLKDEDDEVRRKAIEGLWEYEERQLIPPLCELISNDPAASVRAAAAVALGKFANLAQEGKLLRKDSGRIHDCLLATLQNDNEELEVRRRALEAVAVFNTDSVEKYIQWAYDSDNLDLKSSALYAMGKTGEVLWLSQLVKEMQNPSPPLRYEAANACGELEEEEAIPHLIPLTQDDDLQVQLSAIRAIGTIGGPLAKKALRRCMKLGDPVIEDAAREYLETVDAMEDPLTFKYTP
ncbi:MAG: HEAT repeat domain-containing protein [Chloroflexi bacterium]|nr:HEAT repeat domain-containing protein [Chloroflexota bacterium]